MKNRMVAVKQAKTDSKLVKNIFAYWTIAVLVTGVAVGLVGLHMHMSNFWSHHVNSPDYLWMVSACQIFYAAVTLLAKAGKLISPKWFFPMAACVLIFQVFAITDISIASSHLWKIDESASAPSGGPLSILYLMRDHVEVEMRLGGCMLAQSSQTIDCERTTVQERSRALLGKPPAESDGLCLNQEKKRGADLEKATVFCMLFPGLLRSWKSTLTGALVTLIIGCLVSVSHVSLSVWLAVR